MSKQRFSLKRMEQFILPKSASAAGCEVQYVRHGCIPNRIFSGVMGNSLCHTPVAR